jgi:two-component system chemotaxis sensor kinase CheA
LHVGKYDVAHPEIWISRYRARGSQLTPHMEEVIAEFLIETNEGLGELDNALVKLERNPRDEALVSEIFRVFHTIKGSCGFIGLDRLGKIAHRAEDVLGLVRDRRLDVTSACVTAILDAVDRIRDLVRALEKNGAEPKGSDEDVLQGLENLALAVHDAKHAEAKGGEKPGAKGADEKNSGREGSAADDFSSAARASEGHAEDGDHASEHGAEQGPQTLRVNVDLLEDMMTVVSELVLTRNQLLQTARSAKDNVFATPLQRLNQVVSELQESVMKTRMQPIGNAWSKLPRVVRDVSAELGKRIELEMRGKETELDRQVLDLIKDPLMHMVRNAADHGIETPAERRKVGKPEAGRIVLNSFHEGGYIIIQISDDGRGLPLEKIKGKALQAGIVTKEQLGKLSPQQIQQFIFRAGFSTAEQVTSVSGRGVGMDVVRSNIQRIGGTIEMSSAENRGTTFTIKIPLTLAIVSALIVETAGARFALPQLAVSELVMVGKKNGAKIETINDSSVLRLRDALLPLIYLDDHLKVWDKGKEHAHRQGAVRFVVVTRVAGVQFGIVVDHVLDMEEIVVKPVARNLKGVEIFSGNTILGDGSVIMILDPAGLLAAADIKDLGGHQHLAEEEPEKPLLESSARETLLLLFRAGDRTLKAAPLSQVSRLREIGPADIELSAGRPVLQHLGKLMPVFSYEGAAAREKSVLIIFEHDGRMAGLIADQVLDIAKYYGSLAEAGGHKLLDRIIVDRQATDVVNPAWYVAEGGSDA